jgi:hypothetical protein
VSGRSGESGLRAASPSDDRLPLCVTGTCLIGPESEPAGSERQKKNCPGGASAPRVPSRTSCGPVVSNAAAPNTLSPCRISRPSAPPRALPSALSLRRRAAAVRIGASNLPLPLPSPPPPPPVGTTERASGESSCSAPEGALRRVVTSWTRRFVGLCPPQRRAPTAAGGAKRRSGESERDEASREPAGSSTQPSAERERGPACALRRISPCQRYRVLCGLLPARQKEVQRPSEPWNMWHERRKSARCCQAVVEQCDDALAKKP